MDSPTPQNASIKITMKALKTNNNARTLEVNKVTLGRNRAMFGISRVDQIEKGTMGYYFRLRDHGVFHQKYFSDKAHGGKTKALAAAKEYRSSVLSHATDEAVARASSNRRIVPRSGVKGITHIVARVGAKKYHYWQACWYPDGVIRKVAKYSIAKYGNEKALELAKKRLRKEKKLINSK